MAASADINEDPQGPDSLARRPKAKAFKIEDLLAEVRRGRVRIPTFQRDLKWERDDALKLMDSLYRGYPVGALLLWEREASADELVFQTVRISAAGRTDALWVVDGQQRIVSLIRVLMAPSEDGDAFALFFDLDQNRLLPPPRRRDRADDPARWLPLTVILDFERLMQWIFEFQPDAARRERAFQVGKRIREYEVPAYLVRSDSESTLREIFGRVNTAGKSLNVDEVFEALHGRRGAAVPSSIRDIAIALLPHGFGRVDTKILHLVMSALEGVDSGRGLSEHMSRMSAAQVSEAFGRAAEVTGIVIRFLRESVGIPHYDLLPYKKLMVTLAKFFSYHPVPSSRSKELLTRWVWRGAMNGLHRGDTVSARAALASIRPGDEQESVRRLLEQIEGGRGNTPGVVDPFNFRFAGSKLQTLALLELGPRDLRTGELVQVNDILDADASGVLLPSIVLKTSVAVSPIFHTVANRLVHPVVQGGLRRLILDAPDEKVLLSHGIDVHAVHELKQGNHDQFLRARAAWLAPRMHTFFSAKARWDEPDRASLRSFVVTDDEVDVA